MTSHGVTRMFVARRKWQSKVSTVTPLTLLPGYPVFTTLTLHVLSCFVCVCQCIVCMSVPLTLLPRFSVYVCVCVCVCLPLTLLPGMYCNVTPLIPLPGYPMFMTLMLFPRFVCVCLCIVLAYNFHNYILLLLILLCITIINFSLCILDPMS